MNKDNLYILSIQIKGKDFNRIITKTYELSDSLYSIFNFLDKMYKSLKSINLLHISFTVTDTKANTQIINDITNYILKCKLFVDYCEYNRSRILMYDNKIYPKRKFNIIISDDETFKNADSHTYRKSRSSYQEDRKLRADPNN